MNINLRHSLSIGLFVIGAVIVTVYSHSSKWDRAVYDDTDQESELSNEVAYESYFKFADFYVNRGTQPFLFLSSSDLSVNSLTSKTTFLQPHGKVISATGVPVPYRADKGVLYQKQQFLQLNGHAHAEMEHSVIDSDELKYWASKDELWALGHVDTRRFFPLNGDRLKVLSDKAVAWPGSNRSEYQDNVRGELIRKRPYEEGINFSSNKLTLEGDQQLATLLGNVYVKKQLLTARSQWGEIFLENYNKKLKYFVLYDDVKVTEKVYVAGNSVPTERRAFSEKLEGFMVENKIVLTGYPKVYQESDVIKGNTITLRQNNEVVEVDDANTRFYLK